MDLLLCVQLWLAYYVGHPSEFVVVHVSNGDTRPAPDIEAVASDFYDIEELLTERLHEIHKTDVLDSLRDIADRLKHSIDIDVEIAMGRR